MRVFNHPTSIWSDDERLVIVDNENNRIFIWHEFPETNFAEPDVILGQDNFENVAPNDDDQDGNEDSSAGATGRVLNMPWDAFFHNGQLFVSDQQNNRVLVWNGMPESNFEPADIVIGQEDFESNQPDRGAGQPDATSLDGPRGVIVANGQLFITDTRNSRVLIYDID